MGKPVVYGATYSVYVRIVRLVLEEKGVDHDLVPVDVFARQGLPDRYLERHPFGRIPAFEHDGFRLFETGAICRYIDEAFEGPALQPRDLRQRARMNQIIGLLDSYLYRAMVWDVAVERLEKPQPDEALIASGLKTATTGLGFLSDAVGSGEWLAGEQVTLADLHAAPMLAYFGKVEEGRKLLAGFPRMAIWLSRISARPAFARTGHNP